MFKKYFLVFSILALTGCVTQEQMQANQAALENSLKEYVEIVEIDSFSQKEIYVESKRWLARNFKSSNNVIQYDDPETGTIIGKGNFAFPCTGYIECTAYANSNVNFTLTIESKDNRARLKFDDLGIYMPSSMYNGMVLPGGDKLPIWQEPHKPLVVEKIKNIVSQYVIEIKESSSSGDW